ncbi:hypothetical protein Plim_4045 [Planctopirus limnophila DSM 3776]|uniref:Transmembrane protein n=1 Tax=Planctopirus limnophila (strain ATCC 43296 / DSM 3776 / IFAM 1008 / Mu 290) TaxID=521674 RepID=D5SY63_PLAL2|nr:hypothetical protein [Planctopirus limnophila]ADG69856.1 hypothetical protein Plim_4045 [Planctopirus limnophila DSM 3776]
MRSSSPLTVIRLMMALLALALSPATMVFAQEESTTRPPAASPANQELVQRWIYIPYQNLKQVFGKNDATIALPLSEYLELWNKAHQQSLKPGEKPPVPAVISEARYTAKVEKEAVRLNVQLKVLSLNQGWAVLPISFGDAAVGKVSSSTNRVLLQGLGQGKLALLMPEAGEHVVQFEVVTKVSVSPDGRRFEMQLPNAGISSLELTIPEADQVVELAPAAALELLPTAPGSKETRIRADLGTVEQLKVNWHPRVGSRPDMELLASVTNLTSVQVQDGLIHTHAQLKYDILRGQLASLRIAVPADHRVLDVTSDVRLREWKLSKEGEQQIISVELLGRVDKPATIQVHTERSVPAENFFVAGIVDQQSRGIHALSVLRESGQLALHAGPDVNLTVELQRGLQRTDEAGAAPSIRTPGATYFRYFSPEFELELRARPVEPRLVVNHNSQLIFRDDQLRLNASLDYLVERAGVFELRFGLPEGLTVENVVATGMKQFDVNETTRELVVQFTEKRLGQINLTINGFVPWASASAARNLPLIEPRGAEVENGQVVVFAPEAMEVITETEKVISAQPDPAVAPSQTGNARLVSAWRYQQRPVVIPVSTVRKPSRLTAQVTTRLDVRQGQVSSQTTIGYLVEFAGLSTFRFQVPESVASSVQITSTADAPIKQQSREEKAVDGWVTWTVVLQREVLGRQTFVVTFDVTPQAGTPPEESATLGLVRLIDSPLPESGRNASSESGKNSPAQAEAAKTEEVGNKPASPVVATTVPLTRIVGEVVVTKDRALAVDAVASGGDVESIDTRELTTPVPEGFAAFRYFRQPVEVSLKASKLDVQGVVQTVISRSLVEIVVDKAGVVTGRARYAIKSSERQRLRIDLPGDAQPLGAAMGDRPVALEKTPGASDKGPYTTHFINVARASGADELFHVTILYRLPLSPAPFGSNGGKLLLRMPVWGGLDAQGIVTQQSRVAVWVPQEFSLVSSPTGYTLETRRKFNDLILASPLNSRGLEGLDEWIGQTASGMFDFPREGRGTLYSRLGSGNEITVVWWRLPFYTWIATIVLIVVALLLRRTPLENKLTVLLLAATIAAASAIADADLVLHIVAAMFFGLVAMVLIWLVASIVNCCRPGKPKPVEVPLEQPVVKTKVEEPLAVSTGDASSATSSKPEEPPSQNPTGENQS